METITKEGNKYVAVVDLKDGSAPQKFYGDTHSELVDKLIEAQTNATKKIKEQKRFIRSSAPDPVQPSTKFNPQNLSADEVFRLSHQLQDPQSLPDAIKKLIESQIGAPIDKIRAALQSVEDSKVREVAFNEAQEFIKLHPEYKPTQKNEEILLNYLESHNMGITVKNLEEAFTILQDVLESRETVRPRPAISVLPGGGGANRPPAAKSKLTAKEIFNMSPDEYRRKLSDPEFVKNVQLLYSPKV